LNCEDQLNPKKANMKYSDIDLHANTRLWALSGAVWRAGGAQVGVVMPGGSELVAGSSPGDPRTCSLH
jgi:hypothetical protein